MFEGINLAMRTPFHADGSIDWVRYEELLDIYLDTGVHGFVLSSGTGAHVYLTEAESLKLFEIGIKRIAGRAKVICHTSALVQEEVIRRTQNAADLGADGVMVLPPFFEGPSDDDGVVAFYEAIDTVGIPVIGYNVPAAVGFEVTPALFKRLSALPNFYGVKDSAGDLSKQKVLSMTGGNIINGADAIAFYALLAGAKSLIWGGAGIAPKSCVKLYKQVASADYTGALETWERLFPIMSFAWFDDYVPAVYAACAEMGYDTGAPRRPLSRFNEAHRPALLQALEPLMNERHGL
ncbi:MAG: dihydrodipicolinate synthase family protein [Rhodospirillales bacterium]|jgi:4-hydroxy-tetrahydrodipicolinate synthase|nr:dihydrodipicolinate synthase family protein [Rhodospirillales bacterium]